MVLILGSGIAGLSAALEFAETEQVTLISKSADLLEGASRYAQGGIASVWSKDDSFESHETDTKTAGAGLCNSEVVSICVREGPERIKKLMQWGVQFSEKKKIGLNQADPAEVFDLHREGGHSRRRILHADDLTGYAIVKALADQVSQHPNIKILKEHIAIDLITEAKLFKKFRSEGRCLGAYVLNIKTQEVITLASDVTVLATGGAGKAYLYTSNPDMATGDGIAMAYRAEARVSNLEFIQFHPTCLYHPKAKNFLISEALRGEGAELKNQQGYPFMKDHHPLGSLAPRDIVARAIDFEMKKSGDRFVLLDATHLTESFLKEQFPNIYSRCLQFGFDLSKAPIPVVPAAHYTCGGVVVDTHGLSTIHGLYACGEAASTGLHGANRLASNSLLEAVVFSHRIVEHARNYLRTAPPLRQKNPKALPLWDSGQAVPLEEQIDIAANWSEVRTLMWNYVGIVRSDQRLKRAKKRIELIKAEVNQCYWKYQLTSDLIELRNILQVSELIIESALLRKESRGLHYTVDYPNTDDRYYLRDTVL